MRSLLAAALVLGVILPAQAADLTIAIRGADPAAGPVMIAVYDDAKGFDTPDGAGAVTCVAVTPNTGDMTLHDLKAGRYALKAFQDRNGDRVLNVDASGRPGEPVAVSGTPSPLWPDFEQAAVPVDDRARVVLTLAAR